MTGKRSASNTTTTLPQSLLALRLALRADLPSHRAEMLRRLQGLKPNIKLCSWEDLTHPDTGLICHTDPNELAQLKAQFEAAEDLHQVMLAHQRNRLSGAPADALADYDFDAFWKASAAAGSDPPSPSPLPLPQRGEQRERGWRRRPAPARP